MKNEILDSIGYVDAELIEAADRDPVKTKKTIRLRWVAAAACLCLVIAAAIVIPTLRDRAETPDDPPAATAAMTFALISFDTPEEYAQHELAAGTCTAYYIPASLPDSCRLTRITKREGVYVAAEYAVTPPETAVELNDYDAERLSTLLCVTYLTTDSRLALEESILRNGFAETEYGGETYYRWDEHMEGDPAKPVIGYELAFLRDGILIYLHLPALDSFEQMIRFADVRPVGLR